MKSPTLERLFKEDEKRRVWAILSGYSPPRRWIFVSGPSNKHPLPWKLIEYPKIDIAIIIDGNEQVLTHNISLTNAKKVLKELEQ